MNLIRERWSDVDFLELREYLMSLGNKKIQDFSLTIIPGKSNYIGISIPTLRQIAGEIRKGNIESFLMIHAYYHEEKMIKGLVLSYIKDFDVLLSYLKDFVYEIDSWAICDTTIGSLKIFKKNLNLGLKFIDQLLAQEEEFVIRTGFVLLLSFYITNDYIDYVLEKAVGVKLEAYYVKMVVAWALSYCFIKFPEKTIVVLDGRLDKFTHNKTISKICDSFRVSEEEKNFVRTLRIK